MGGLGLHAGERAPMQVWTPWPKATCRSSRRGQFEIGGIGPAGRIAVGRGEVDDHPLLGLDRLAADGDVAGGAADDHLGRRIDAQGFLDGGLDEGRIGAQGGPIAGFLPSD